MDRWLRPPVVVQAAARGAIDGRILLGLSDALGPRRYLDGTAVAQFLSTFPACCRRSPSDPGIHLPITWQAGDSKRNVTGAPPLPCVVWSQNVRVSRVLRGPSVGVAGCP